MIESAGTVSIESKLAPSRAHASPRRRFSKSLQFVPAQNHIRPACCKSGAKAESPLSAGSPPKSPAPEVRGILPPHGDTPRKQCPHAPRNSLEYSRAIRTPSLLPADASSWQSTFRESRQFRPGSEYPVRAGKRTEPECAAFRSNSEMNLLGHQLRRSRMQMAVGAQSSLSKPALAALADLLAHRDTPRPALRKATSKLRPRQNLLRARAHQLESRRYLETHPESHALRRDALSLQSPLR